LGTGEPEERGNVKDGNGSARRTRKSRLVEKVPREPGWENVRKHMEREERSEEFLHCENCENSKGGKCLEERGKMH
jgi:hypothetical protein